MLQVGRFESALQIVNTCCTWRYCSWDTWDEVFERLAQIVVFVGCRNTGRKAGDKTRFGTSLPTNSDATLEQKFKSVTCLNPGEFLLPELIYEASVSKIVTFQQSGQAPNFGCSLTALVLSQIGIWQQQGPTGLRTCYMATPTHARHSKSNPE